MAPQGTAGCPVAVERSSAGAAAALQSPAVVRVDWDLDAAGARTGVVVITLDRPERRNAVDHATLLQLLDAQQLARTERARVVVLTGAPPAFCAGADLTGVEEGEFATVLGRVLRGFGELAVPTIAAVDGAALGAGTQLVVACDLRVATPASRFGIPAARLGLVVDQWTVERLARELSWPVARAMLLGAETYPTERLHAVGAVHRVGGGDDAIEWARELAGLAPLTIAGHKLALERSAGEPEADPAVEAARRAAWASADAQEGRAAFLAKRTPRFRGE
jgi:enoyl-CoA hydratase